MNGLIYAQQTTRDEGRRFRPRFDGFLKKNFLLGASKNGYSVADSEGRVRLIRAFKLFFTRVII